MDVHSWWYKILISRILNNHLFLLTKLAWHRKSPNNLLRSNVFYIFPLLFQHPSIFVIKKFLKPFQMVEVFKFFRKKCSSQFTVSKNWEQRNSDVTRNLTRVRFNLIWKNSKWIKIMILINIVFNFKVKMLNQLKLRLAAVSCLLC